MLKQKTVYFREEDLPLWEAIENKAEWLHRQLKPEIDDLTKSAGDYGYEPLKPYPPKAIKTKQDAVKAVKKIAPVTYVPKTNWGA